MQSVRSRCRRRGFGVCLVQALLYVAFLLQGGAPAACGQILTANAGVASPELPSVRELLVLRRYEELDELRALTQATWSPTTWLETRLTVPLVYRSAAFQPTGLPRREEDLFGLGDLELRLKASLWQDDDVLESTRWAVMAEGIAPTGRHHESSGGVELPRKLQISPGGWGIGAGTAFTVIRDRHRFSTELFWRHRTRHDGFRLGDSFHWNLAWWYRIHPARFDPRAETVEVRGVVEVLGTWRLDSELSGGDPEDGGLEAWLAPGVQVYLSRDVLLEAALLVPLSQDIDDPLGGRRLGALLGLKLIF